MRVIFLVVAIGIFVGCGQPGAPLKETTPPTGTPTIVSTPAPQRVPVSVVKPTSTPPAGWIEIQADRWQRARTRPDKVHFAQAIARQIERNQSRYQAVSGKTGVPWQVVAVIHNMEGSLNFRTNLGQGDPLTARSRHEPKGRPPTGSPPFSWEFAAIDSLEYDRMNRKTWVPIGLQLNNIELWNGAGYQRYHASVPTPYLWSWSTLEKPGKYVADGVWSSTARSEQCGVVPILKALAPP